MITLVKLATILILLLAKVVVKDSDLKLLLVGENQVYMVQIFRQNPTIPFAPINYLISFDRKRLLNTNKVLVINGTKSYYAQKETLGKLAVNSIKVKTTISGVIPSDYTFFYRQDILSIHYLSNQSIKHNKSINLAFLSYNGIYKVSKHVLAIIYNLDSVEEIEFIKTKDVKKGLTVS